MRLNPRHEQFARICAVTGDATAAAKQVGYKDGHGLKVTAHKLMQKPEVQAIIEQERARLAENQEISNDQLIREVLEIARTGNAPAAARVSAYKLVAEVKGFLASPSTPLPDALNSMLEAVARGTVQAAQQRQQPAIEVPYREVPAG